MKSKKRTVSLFAAIASAVVLLLSAVLSLGLSPASSGVAKAEGEQRVTMLDLMDRYPINYVLGPMAKKSTNPDHGTPVRDGEGNITHVLDERNNIVYVDDDGNVLKDRGGEENTNNAYGIPRGQYFNIESYIYTEPNSDLDGEGRTLFGWKKDIVGVAKGLTDTSNPISEEGFIKDGENAGKVGIYYLYGDSFWFITRGNKYALIVPDDVTQIGQSYGGYVVGNTAYYTEGGKAATSTNANNAKFTDFGNGLYHTPQPDNFWQPRERLLGVYFNETSNLKSIAGGCDLTGDDGTYDRMAMGDKDTTGGSNRSQRSSAGKSAFARCDNMRFFIMPDRTSGPNAVTGVQSIGEDAFWFCNQLVDVNIPSSVTTLKSRAFGYCGSLLHITLHEDLENSGSVFEGCGKLKDVVDLSGNFEGSFASTLFNYTKSDAGSKLYVIGGTLNDTGVNGFYLCQNTSGRNIAGLATITNNNKSYINGNWYAVGLAGKADESGQTVYTLPEGIGDSSPYRMNIEYDYLDMAGRKIKHDIGKTDTDADGDGQNDNIVINNYDIAAGFAQDTWCSNIVISKAVDIIGDNAFNGAHTRYMETYATYYGASSFANNSDTSEVNNKAQWYYIHPSAGGKYVGGTSAFGDCGTTRYYIFEEQKTLSTPFNTKNGVARYLIPIIANVYSEEDVDATVLDSDMSTRFYNDSDYVENPTLKAGNNAIIYTKRLSGSGFNFNYTKQANGHWISDSTQSTMVASHNNPKLGHMTSTVWYENSDYSGRVIKKNGNKVEDLYSNSATAINVYTKNIARPENIKDKTYDGKFKGKYEFGKTYDFGALGTKKLGEGANEFIDYFTALGLSDDYSVTLTRFTYADGRMTGTDTTTALRNAGTYQFSVNLAEKWGSWSQEYLLKTENDGYFNATATVERKKIDFTSLGNVPDFVNAANGGQYSLHGTATPLYYHSGGWYESHRSGNLSMQRRPYPMLTATIRALRLRSSCAAKPSRMRRAAFLPLRAQTI